MPKIFEGSLNVSEQLVAVIVSRFNSLVTDKLLEGAVDALVRSGLQDEHIHVYRVPGSFEIPSTVSKILENQKDPAKPHYDGIICIGAVVRGDTPHFDYVSAEAIKGIAHLSLTADIPVIMGVLTTDTLEQALDRAGAKAGNKGFEAARTLVEMISLYEKM
ncbi:MAG: 6,7-dimethyl-8-ribityllumazine synthase [Deltaproteobacteria bacterium]|nr:6,7-dimethyl-8-ribityllumazine synthase [Deltaproteobacteria bacterium]